MRRLLLCLPPLYEQYEFPLNGAEFHLVQDIQSTEDYHYMTQRTIEELAYTYNSVDMEQGFNGLTFMLSQEIVDQAKQIWHTCERKETCTRYELWKIMCKEHTCSGDSITVTYPPDGFQASVDDQWYIKYNTHTFASGTPGVASATIIPIEQYCYTFGTCPEQQNITLTKPILPYSKSSFHLETRLEYDLESAKDFFHSQYTDLKNQALQKGPLPDSFATLDISQDNIDALTMVYEACEDEACERYIMYTATCAGPTRCGTTVQVDLNPSHYYVEILDTNWQVKNTNKDIIAEAPIGESATQITIGGKTVLLATPYEPLYLGAYNIGETVTCEFGTPEATCIDDTLHLSGCYKNLQEECQSITVREEYITKQCCECNGVSETT